MQMQARILGMVLVLGVLLPALAKAQDLEAEAAQIRALDKQWVATAQRKDAAATANFYAEDGAILPANEPLAKGRAAIAQVWATLFKLPSFDISFAATEVTVSKAADLAYEIGTYSLSFQGKTGPVKDSGKYVVVWKKSSAEWKAAADIFNSDMAAE